MKNKLKIFPAYIYQIAFNSGLALCGAERTGEPMFIGTGKQFAQFNAGIEQLFNKQADSLS